ncbi:NAD-dependent succinate-semialdehyde dehydrogenase [Alkalihalobacillus oceani]|uniref:NAD-dependent succinate-semialdehyde dehydrogenase n=1 Tax=Halalkalibacter oceani TaxID=1653776 RepID=UPI002041A0B3|nr:NAD-dependent succinate-semialdehyde dehydrogenase [Halalkalibacter oceani]MCM3761335.1 NAD-dependent succinate-semialdehyde dehydrogenase [Halalkalibacter oceani]
MSENLYINGEWVEPANGKYYPSYNPATHEVVGEVADGREEDMKKAIEAADAAFEEWAGLTALERADYLMKCYDKMKERQDELAELMTKEQGKPLHEAKAEVNGAADFFRWFAEEARRVYGETIPASAKNKRIKVIKQPVGVVVAITPWNFPQTMVTRKVAPALAAGCPVIVKPAKQTPLNAVALFKIFDEVGLPKGVVNLITTDKSSTISNEMFSNEKVRKITFTGSTEVGKMLTREAANQMKRVSMELGGHSPFIVFEDADLDKAIEGVMQSKFRNAGQTCVCANRVYVQKSIQKEFEQKFIEKVQKLKVGNGLEEGVQIGPLIDGAAVKKQIEQVEDAVSKGAKVIIGGNQTGSQGSFYEPTILSNVKDDMKITHEETFGPIAPVITFETEEEVIQRANNVKYGLAAYYYTQDFSRSIRVQEKLDYGVIGLNDALPAVPQAPFGGMKESGVGREGGHQGLDDFLETKYISMQI